MRRAHEVLDAIDAAFASASVEETGVDDLVAGDREAESILVFADGDRWVVSVWPAMEGEGER